MSTEPEEKTLTTADLAAAAVTPTAQREVNRDSKESVIENENSGVRSEDEKLAPLFLPDVSKDFRSHWDAVQISFVDDPRQAVRQADELVAQVMKGLAETFSNERAKLEAQVDQTDKASTENLRALPYVVIARFLSACCLFRVASERTKCLRQIGMA